MNKLSHFSYLKSVWVARHFWLHLAMSDIRAKYRRSLFGLIWAVAHPFIMTLLLSFVMGHIFHVAAKSYAPFIFSGLVLWEFITTFMMTGCSAFINAEPYIKQFNHPLLIYTLRTVIFSLINFCCAFIGIIIWVFCWKPSNFGFSWLSLFPSVCLLFLFAWPLSTVNAFIGARFRDFSQLLTIIFQVLYYVSPILFLPKLFIDANLDFILEYNPIAHLLNLFRKPLLEGIYPRLEDYLFIIGVSLFLWFFVWINICLNEKKIIYYL